MTWVNVINILEPRGRIIRIGRRQVNGNDSGSLENLNLNYCFMTLFHRDDPCILEVCDDETGNCVTDCSYKYLFILGLVYYDDVQLCPLLSALAQTRSAQYSTTISLFSGGGMLHKEENMLTQPYI